MALPQVVLFNHISWVDSLVLMRMFAPSGVAKVPLESLLRRANAFSDQNHVEVSFQRSPSAIERSPSPEALHTCSAQDGIIATSPYP